MYAISKSFFGYFTSDELSLLSVTAALCLVRCELSIQEHWDVKPKNKQGTMHSPNGMQLAK